MEFFANRMHVLVLSIVRGIVDNRDAVHLTAQTTDKSVIFTIGVALEDQGKVIGKQGRTARAMRTILEAVSRKEGFHTELVILEKGKERL